MKNDSNPIHHTRKMAARLRETIEHLRADIDKVDEPQVQVDVRDVSRGAGRLVKAFEDYEKKNESASSRSQKETRGVAFGP